LLSYVSLLIHRPRPPSSPIFNFPQPSPALPNGVVFAVFRFIRFPTILFSPPFPLPNFGHNLVALHSFRLLWVAPFFFSYQMPSISLFFPPAPPVFKFPLLPFPSFRLFPFVSLRNLVFSFVWPYFPPPLLLRPPSCCRASILSQFPFGFFYFFFLFVLVGPLFLIPLPYLSFFVIFLFLSHLPSLIPFRTRDCKKPRTFPKTLRFCIVSPLSPFENRRLVFA